MPAYIPLLSSSRFNFYTHYQLESLQLTDLKCAAEYELATQALLPVVVAQSRRHTP